MDELSKIVVYKRIFNNKSEREDDNIFAQKNVNHIFKTIKY